MTHSTCCKAEVIHEGDTIYCSKCKEYLMALTPPPVPSEIEEFKKKWYPIVEHSDDCGMYYRKNCTCGADKNNKEFLFDLTALLTHHTSVQVKERTRQFQLLYGMFNSDTGELMDYKTNEYGENPVDLLIKFLTAQAAEGE